MSVSSMNASRARRKRWRHVANRTLDERVIHSVQTFLMRRHVKALRIWGVCGLTRFHVIVKLNFSLIRYIDLYIYIDLFIFYA